MCPHPPVHNHQDGGLLWALRATLHKGLVTAPSLIP